jgi:hypothetical protein
VEELLEGIIPGGPWLAVGIVLGAALGGRLRPLAKGVLKTGLAVTDRLQGVAGEAVERTQDLVAEARAERAAAKPKPAPGGTSTRRTTPRTT